MGNTGNLKKLSDNENAKLFVQDRTGIIKGPLLLVVNPERSMICGIIYFTSIDFCTSSIPSFLPRFLLYFFSIALFQCSITPRLDIPALFR